VNNRAFVARTLGITAGVLVLAMIPYAAGIRINGTESLPPGVWQVMGGAGVARRGEIVNFCPPDVPALREAKARHYMHGGLCPGDYETLFKPVVAVAGDTVVVTDEGVRVNGALIHNSIQAAADGTGAAMPRVPHGTYQVAAGTAWVVSSYTPWSFDSRYFGPIPTAAIRGRARPLWTWTDQSP
jgi:conjugative transfer signal peptidase TraF